MKQLITLYTFLLTLTILSFGMVFCSFGCSDDASSTTAQTLLPTVPTPSPSPTLVPTPTVVGDISQFLTEDSGWHYNSTTGELLIQFSFQSDPGINITTLKLLEINNPGFPFTEASAGTISELATTDGPVDGWTHINGGTHITWNGPALIYTRQYHTIALLEGDLDYIKESLPEDRILFFDAMDVGDPLAPGVMPLEHKDL